MLSNNEIVMDDDMAAVHPKLLSLDEIKEMQTSKHQKITAGCEQMIEKHDNLRQQYVAMFQENQSYQAENLRLQQELEKAYEIIRALKSKSIN